MSFIALCHRGKHPVNGCIDYHIKLFIISLGIRLAASSSEISSISLPKILLYIYVLQIA